MPRSTRGKRGKFNLMKRLLSPVEEGVGLLSDVGQSAFRRSKNVLRAGVGFAGNTVRSTGKRANAAVGRLIGRKTRRNTRKNRRSRSQRR
jgi:hypothetical protein